MNVYDFDDTIYNGDSSKDFIFYIVIRHPWIMTKELPGMFVSGVQYLLGMKTKKEMKSRFFRFLSQLKNVEGDVKDFWDKNEHKIKSWYLSQKKSSDVIISASPEFLLKEICSRLEISTLIATNIDTKTGTILGKNCKKEEKVCRFYEVFPEGVIHEFYSDNDSDRFLAEKSIKSYLVKKEKILEWHVLL